jgi:hypothetical protein
MLISLGYETIEIRESRSISFCIGRTLHESHIVMPNNTGKTDVDSGTGKSRPQLLQAVAAGLISSPQNGHVLIVCLIKPLMRRLGGHYRNAADVQTERG